MWHCTWQGRVLCCAVLCSPVVCAASTNPTHPLARLLAGSLTVMNIHCIASLTMLCYAVLRYLLELGTVLSPELGKRGCLAATGALSCALQLLGLPHWPEALKALSGFTWGEVQGVVLQMRFVQGESGARTAACSLHCSMGLILQPLHIALQYVDQLL